MEKVLPGWSYMRRRQIPLELPELTDNLEQMTSPVLGPPQGVHNAEHQADFAWLKGRNQAKPHGKNIMTVPTSIFFSCKDIQAAQSAGRCCSPWCCTGAPDTQLGSLGWMAPGDGMSPSHHCGLDTRMRYSCTNHRESHWEKS